MTIASYISTSRSIQSHPPVAMAMFLRCCHIAMCTSTIKASHTIFVCAKSYINLRTQTARHSFGWTKSVPGRLLLVQIAQVRLKIGKYKVLTRMHSSRMRTVRCSSRGGGVCQEGACPQGCVYQGGCLPHPLCEQNHRGL